jgi:hypothetical protein
MSRTIHKLLPGTPIRISNAYSRRVARGKFVRMTHNGFVEYRCYYNLGLYYAPLAEVHIDRALVKRKKQYTPCALF